MSYPSEKRFGHDGKILVNNCVKRMIPIFKIRKNIATVLDDYNFQSTKSLTDYNEVVISQNDKSHYEQMMYTIPIKNVRLFYCDYEALTDTFIGQHTIDLDHADFCQSWDSMKGGIFDRLENNEYSDRALLRLTVCRRGTFNKHGRTKGMTLERCVDKVEEELQNVVCNYTVKPLKMKDWCLTKNERAQMQLGYRESTAYVYSNMINMIFLITRNFVTFK